MRNTALKILSLFALAFLLQQCARQADSAKNDEAAPTATPDFRPYVIEDSTAIVTYANGLKLYTVRQGPGEFGPAFDPRFEVGVFAKTCGFKIDHAFHRPARKIHRPGVGFFQRLCRAFIAQTQDQLVANDAAAHVSVQQKAQLCVIEAQLMQDGDTPGAVRVHDLHATVLHQLGLDHTRLTHTFQGRRYRLTDVHGHVVKDLLA